MDGAEIMRSAWDGLRSHKMRSGLTALGVIFGVAAVIGMASIGEGARRETLRLIDLMGASNILIEHARPEEGDPRTQSLARNPLGLTVNDANALKELVPDAGVVAPLRIVNTRVKAGGRSAKLSVVATTPAQFALDNLRAELGRLLLPLDDTDFRRVCVLGSEARRELFPLENPLGRDVVIDGQPYMVVGVAEPRLAGGGQIAGVDLRDTNLDVHIPLATSLKRHPPPPQESELTRIIVHLPGPEKLSEASRLITRIMTRRHRDVADFNVIVPEELLRQHQATQRIFNIVMGTIASISLIVGGIGIMNIMLASVLERTREIGIRRAVGAREIDIARQFLAEAVALSLFGGVIGVGLGLGLALGISAYAGWETAVSVWAVIIAVGVAVGVGVAFGWLPARRAAKLDPIVALRYE